VTTCANCGVELTGRYCESCGQKRFVESDRRFGHLVRQLLASATDLDGRVWRSLLALLFKPGLLSREYIDGRRARWISPISLFLAVNVIYFLAPLHGGDLALQFNQQVSARIRELANPGTPLSAAQIASNGQAHTSFTMPLIDERVRLRNEQVDPDKRWDGRSLLSRVETIVKDPVRSCLVHVQRYDARGDDETVGTHASDERVFAIVLVEDHACPSAGTCGERGVWRRIGRAGGD
jgi:hypothetical protein